MRPIKQRAPVGRPSKTETGVTEASEGNASRRLHITPRPEVEAVCRLALLTYLQSVDATIGEVAKEIIFTESHRERGTARAGHELWFKLATLLATLRVVDPACGEGHMLLGMLDLLDITGRIVDERLGRHESVAARRARIVQHNLFGVEAQGERADTCRARLLSLAAYAVGQGAANTIFTGDSLVERPGFRWESHFDSVFQAGGFHLVIGNPPYVRHERICDPLRQMEPELYKRRALEEAGAAMRRSWTDDIGRDTCSLDGRSDLSLLFTLKGLSLLRPDGVLCFVLPTALFGARYGHALHAALERSERHADFVENLERRSFADVGVNTGILAVGPRRPGVISGAHRRDEREKLLERTLPNAGAAKRHTVLGAALPSPVYRAARRKPIHTTRHVGSPPVSRKNRAEPIFLSRRHGAIPVRYRTLLLDASREISSRRGCHPDMRRRADHPIVCLSVFRGAAAPARRRRSGRVYLVGSAASYRATRQKHISPLAFGAIARRAKTLVFRVRAGSGPLALSAVLLPAFFHCRLAAGNHRRSDVLWVGNRSS